MSIDKKRWILLVIQGIIGTLSSFAYILTIFLGPLSETRGWGIPNIVLAFTVSMWIGTPALVFAGKLRDTFGNKKLIIVGAICYGITIIASAFVSSVTAYVVLIGGVSSIFMFIIYSAQLANVGEMFPDRRGMATGLYFSILNISVGLLAPIVEFLIRYYGVTNAIIIVGAACGVLMVVLGLFVFNPPENYCPKGWSPNTSKLETITAGPEYTWKQMIKTPAYYAIVLTLLFLGISGQYIAVNASLLAQNSLGVGTAAGAWIVAASSICGAVGGFLFGTICDKFGAAKAFLSIGAVMLAMQVVYLVFAQGNPLLFTLAIGSISLGYAGVGSLISTVTMNTFGIKNFGLNFSIIGISQLLASVMVPLVVAKLSPINTLVSFAVFAAVAMVGSVLANKGIKSVFSKWLAEKNAAQQDT